MNFDKYSHKEIWARRGKTCNIEVHRWQYPNLFNGGVDYVWNVYCYIFPTNPMFNKLEEDICGTNIENLHGGCTYCKWNRDEEGNVTCKTYGSDYNHLYDDRFLKMKNPEDAYEVFSDAEALFNELEGAK